MEKSERLLNVVEVRPPEEKPPTSVKKQLHPRKQLTEKLKRELLQKER